MEAEIKKLEALVEKKFEDWTSDTVIEIVNDIEKLKLFTPELIFYIVDNRKNNEIYNILTPVKYGYLIRNTKSAIEEMLIDLKEGSKNQDIFEKKVLELKLEEFYQNPVSQMCIYLTIVTGFNDTYNLSLERKEILETIKSFKKILLSLSFELGFEVITEMLDILFPFREIYFHRYQEDVIKDDEEIADLMDRLNDMTKQILSAMKNEDIEDSCEEDCDCEICNNHEEN